MKLTNYYDLPIAIVHAVENDDYNNNGTYSATTLLRCPKEIILTERHSDEIEQDVSDLMFPLLGTSIHYILEKAGVGDSEFSEERLYYNFDGDVISGKFDIYNMETCMLGDYKVTSVSNYRRGDNYAYRFQMLVYGFLLRQNGFQCKGAVIYQIFRDWQKERAMNDPAYPQKFVNRIEMVFSEADFEWIEKEIRGRLSAINICKQLDDDDIPICNKEARWTSEDKYAVMKNGKKRATKIFLNRCEAEDFVRDGGGDYIEDRPGLSKKCRDYCVCRKFCNFWRENYKKEEPF